MTMNPENPIVAFTIGMFNAVDGPSYCVYTQAYGMEMQVDDEWPLNVLIMAPPHLVVSLTSEADVVSMGMIPGASYTPGDGDYSQISENGGQWVLARPSDDLQKIVRNGLGVLLVIDSADDIDSISNFRGLSSENMIVAFPIDSVSTLTTATQMLTEIQTKFAAKQISARILISGSFAHKDLTDYMTIDGASGLLLLDASSDSILELIHNILG
ncbi:MAG: hypothetical protein ACK57G_16290 [Planctomycetota bacterium]|jgi:hypothetical protein